VVALFDEVGDRFLSYYASAQGIVRERIVQENLRALLPQRRLDVLDVGCGEGRDAVWLTSLGHNVVAIDPSQTMLKAARVRAAQIPDPEKRLRLRILCCDAEEATSKFGEHSFDVVVCHGVIMYQDDDERFVSELARLLRPGGLLSLLAGFLGFRRSEAAESQPESQ
jgi:SAM-dependent methyltransferase